MSIYLSSLFCAFVLNHVVMADVVAPEIFQFSRTMSDAVDKNLERRKFLHSIEKRRINAGKKKRSRDDSRSVCCRAVSVGFFIYYWFGKLTSNYVIYC